MLFYLTQVLVWTDEVEVVRIRAVHRVLDASWPDARLTAVRNHLVFAFDDV